MIYTVWCNSPNSTRTSPTDTRANRTDGDMKKQDITRRHFAEAFTYDHATGLLTRINSRRQQRPAGCIDSHGYRFANLFGHKFAAHRVVWSLVYGDPVPDFIDHINGDRLDNRVANLRPASYSTNNQNRRGPSRNSTTGYLGVSQLSCRPLKKKYIASIKVHGVKRYLGGFEFAEDAYEAYVKAKRELHQGNTI